MQFSWQFKFTVSHGTMVDLLAKAATSGDLTGIGESTSKITYVVVGRGQ